MEECYYGGSCQIKSKGSKLQTIYNLQYAEIFEIVHQHGFPLDISHFILLFVCPSFRKYVSNPLQMSVVAVDEYFLRFEFIQMSLCDNGNCVKISGSNAGTYLCLDCFIANFLKPTFDLYRMFDGRYAPPFIQKIQTDLKTTYLQRLSMLD